MQLAVGLALSLLVAGLGAAGAGAPPVVSLVAVGTGEATYPGCPASSDRLAFAGALIGSAWRFVVTDANDGEGGFCGIVVGEVYEGPWRPEDGGCLDSIFAGAVRQLCLENPQRAWPAIHYDVRVRIFLAGTVTGNASLLVV